MKTITILKGQNETSRKALAGVLNVSLSKVNKAVEEKISGYNAPDWMVFSTSKGKILYNVEIFAKMLNIPVKVIEVKRKIDIDNEKYKEILKTQGKKSAKDFWLNRNK